MWPAEMWQASGNSWAYGSGKSYFSQNLFCLCYMQFLVEPLQLLLCSWSWQVLLHPALSGHRERQLWFGRGYSACYGDWTRGTTTVQIYTRFDITLYIQFCVKFKVKCIECCHVLMWVSRASHIYLIFIFFLHGPRGTHDSSLIIGNSMLDAVDGTRETKGASKVQNSIRIMKEKISLLSKRGKKLVKKEKKLKSQLDKFKGA